MGEKEALSFLKKNNKSIIRAWEDYKTQVGHSNNSQLDSVFEQMFKAWVISNKKAITLLEKTSKKAKKPTKTVKSRAIKPKKTKSKNQKK